MATLTVRDVPDGEREALRRLAAKHGRSMEAEIRLLIREAVRCTVAEDELHERVRMVQESVRALHGGVMPTGVVDSFIAERRAAAARGE